MDLDQAIQWKQYLSPQEQKFLDTVNYHSNKIRKNMKKKEQFSNYPIKKVYKKWSTSMYDVMNLIIKDVSKINKKKYKKDNWWQQYVDIVQAIYKILVKKNYIIYVGITFVLLSLFLHFIFISS